MTREVDSGDKTLHPTFSVIPCTDCGFRTISLETNLFIKKVLNCNSIPGFKAAFVFSFCGSSSVVGLHSVNKGKQHRLLGEIYHNCVLALRSRQSESA